MGKSETTCGRAMWLVVCALPMIASAARAEDRDLHPLEQRPALMARSRALSKPVPAPLPKAAPDAVPAPKARGGGVDDDSLRPAGPSHPR